MSEIPKVPELPAYNIGNGQWAAWCVHCRRWHRHGLIGERTHRVAHCRFAESPYLETGYILRDAGRASPAVLADANRAEPHGPGAAA